MMRGPPHALANMIRQDEMLMGNVPGMHPRTNRGHQSHHDEDANTGRKHFFPGIQPHHRGPGRHAVARSMAGRAVDQMYGNQDDRRGQHGQHADMMGAMVGNGLVDNRAPVAESGDHQVAASIDFDNGISADADNEWGA